MAATRLGGGALGGEGFVLDVAPNIVDGDQEGWQMVATYYTYDGMGNQVWLIGNDVIAGGFGLGGLIELDLDGGEGKDLLIVGDGPQRPALQALAADSIQLAPLVLAAAEQSGARLCASRVIRLTK